MLFGGNLDKTGKRTNVRPRPWKITETPVTDMKQTAAEGTLNKGYPGGSVTTTKDDNCTISKKWTILIMRRKKRV